MKKTALFMTALAALSLLIGCGGDGDDDGTPTNVENPSTITEEFQTFYVKVLDQNRTAAPDISTGARWHFHNNVNSGGAVGFAIQKVFVNDSLSEEGAIILYNFTDASDFASANKGAFDAGSMDTGSVSGGAWTVERTDTAYKYLGNLASGAEVNGKAYWGFVIKNAGAAAKADNVNLEIVNSDAARVAISSIAGWFGIGTFGAYEEEPTEPTEPDTPSPVLTSEFATYYLDIAAKEFTGVEGIHFHNKTASELGMVVDRIFATNTLGLAEAVIQEFDGTDDPESGSYYWSNFSGTDGIATVGVAAGEGNYAYIGGFATPLFVDKAYIGIVARNVSDTVKGDEITVQPIIGSEPDDSKSKTFAELFVSGVSASVPVLTSEFAAYYLDIIAKGLTVADNTIHLKNKSAGPVGIEIQQIYVSTTKSLTDAALVWDFTAEAPKVDAYWGFGNGSANADDKWTSGEVAAPEAGMETYITGFGSGAAYDHSAVYWIFIAKNVSNTVKGDDVTIEIGGGDPYTATVSKTFAELFTK